MTWECPNCKSPHHLAVDEGYDFNEDIQGKKREFECMRCGHWWTRLELIAADPLQKIERLARRLFQDSSLFGADWHNDQEDAGRNMWRAKARALNEQMEEESHERTR